MNQYKKALLIGILFLYLNAIFIPMAYACPHYDEYGDEFFLIFDEDYNGQMIYFNDIFDRYIYLDQYYNELYEEFIVLVSSDNLEITKGTTTVGNRKYWFDLPLGKLITVSSESQNKLFNIIYTLSTVVINNNHEEKLSTISSIIDNSNMHALKGTIIDLTFKVTQEYRDSSPTKVIEFKNFSTPVKVTYDLAPYNLTDEEANNLKAIYLKPSSGNRYSIVELKGNYNRQNNHFSFNTSYIGIHSIVINGSSIIDIEKTENIAKVNVEDSINSSDYKDAKIDEINDSLKNEPLPIENNVDNDDIGDNKEDENVFLPSAKTNIRYIIIMLMFVLSLLVLIPIRYVKTKR